MTSFFFLLCTECSFGTQSHGRLAAGQGVGEEPHQSPAAPQGGPASALLGLPLRQPAASRRRDLRHMRVRPECGGMQGESVCSWQVLTPYNSVFSGRGESIGFSRTLEGDVQIPDHSRSKISPARLCGAFLLFPALCHWASLKACCWENYHRALSGDWLACRRMTDCKQHCIFMVFAVRRSQNWVLLLPPLGLCQQHFFLARDTVLEQCRDVLCMIDWYDTQAPVFYWSRCHTALHWAWFCRRSAVSRRAQSPAVWSAFCQWHSGPSHGVISMLSVDLCQPPSGWMPSPSLPTCPSCSSVSVAP